MARGKHAAYRFKSGPLADTQPWRMHPWRYRIAKTALAVCNVTIAAALTVIALAAIGGAYLAITHKPVPAPIARILDPPAQSSRARDHAP